MKNKKLLLVATAALGVLALGTAGAATAAWFTASDAATIKSASGSTGSITAQESTVDVGDFTITVAVSVDDGDVVLSKNQETPYTAVLVNGVEQEASKPAGTVWASTVTVKYSVAYDGTTGTSTEIDAMWDALIGSTDLTFTVTASGTGASLVRWVANATTDLRGTVQTTATLTVTASAAKALTSNGEDGSSWAIAQQTIGTNLYCALNGTGEDQDTYKTATVTLTGSVSH